MLRRWLDIPIIIWEYDWMARVVWYIYQHLVHIYGKCRQIYHNYMDPMGYSCNWFKFRHLGSFSWAPRPTSRPPKKMWWISLIPSVNDEHFTGWNRKRHPWDTHKIHRAAREIFSGCEQPLGNVKNPPADRAPKNDWPAAVWLGDLGAKKSGQKAFEQLVEFSRNSIYYNNCIRIALYGFWNCPLWEYHGIPIIVRNQIYTNDESRCPLSNSQFWQEKTVCTQPDLNDLNLPKMFGTVSAYQFCGHANTFDSMLPFFLKTSPKMQLVGWDYILSFQKIYTYIYIYVYIFISDIVIYSFILYL